MKNEVGIYVRTEEGKIFKTDGDKLYLSNNKKIFYRLLTRIPHESASYKVIKSSYNIIDLIEENDIVEYRITGNKYISKVEGHPEFGKWKLNVYFYEEFIDLEKLDIISVLTHEQFDNIKYEVE